jgi:hypothetical protein
MTASSYPIELVVARHEEDLRWLRRVPKEIRITVYNKGKTSALPEGFQERKNLAVITLPNEGREAHTYLTHLTERYETLAENTVFCQGHPFDHAPDFHDGLRALGERRERSEPFLWYGFLEETDDREGKRLFVPWSKNPERRKLETWCLYEELFGEASPEFFHFRGGAQFSVNRQAVHRRPGDFYRRALELVGAIPLAAHSYERIWDRLFGSPVINPLELGPEGVRYLKPIRRLAENQGRGGVPWGTPDSV